MKQQTKPLIFGGVTIICERCKRTFTSMSQLKVIHTEYVSMAQANPPTHYVCRHTAACSKRKEQE